MPLSLIVGPPNSGRVEEVITRLRDDLVRDPVLVVPRAVDAERYEQMLCAGGRATVGVSITTFAWLVEDLARALGLRIPPALSRPQRLALVRAATHAAPLGVLARSAHHPGFATALERLIAELQGSLIEPQDLARRAEELEDGVYEAELAVLYATYVRLRERAGRSDPGSVATAVLAASLGLDEAWGARPVYVYGFDDLTAVQREVLAALARSAEVTVAVTYDDREALSARAGLLHQLQDELDGAVAARLVHDPSYAESGLLAHLDRGLFDVDAGAHDADGGVVMLESAGALGEAEAIGVEIASLLAGGEAVADDIAVVLRHPARGGPLIGRVLARFGIPAAVEAEVPLARTAVGHSLSALCRAELPGGTAADLLAHLRADVAFPATIADLLERRIARGEVRTPDEAFAGWQTPPRHLSMLRGASGGPARLRGAC
jgi:ATP-dependent helicase/DNAse subunit B